MNMLFDNLPESELDSIQESAQAGIIRSFLVTSSQDSTMLDMDVD